MRPRASRHARRSAVSPPRTGWGRGRAGAARGLPKPRGPPARHRRPRYTESSEGASGRRASAVDRGSRSGCRSSRPAAPRCCPRPPPRASPPPTSRRTCRDERAGAREGAGRLEAVGHGRARRDSTSRSPMPGSPGDEVGEVAHAIREHHRLAESAPRESRADGARWRPTVAVGPVVSTASRSRGSTGRRRTHSERRPATSQPRRGREA